MFLFRLKDSRGCDCIPRVTKMCWLAGATARADAPQGNGALQQLALQPAARRCRRRSHYASRSPSANSVCRQRLPYHQNAQTRRARGDRGKCRTNSSLRENIIARLAQSPGTSCYPRQTRRIAHGRKDIFSDGAGVIFAVVAAFHLVCILEEWPVIYRGLVSAEVGKLGRRHRRWWPRPSRVETRSA